MSAISLNRLAYDIDAFLRFKRALGHPYQRGEHTLRSFERFAQEQAAHQKRSRVDLEPTIKAWMSRFEGRKAVTVATDLGAVRQLCLYRRRVDPSCFVPEHALAPQVESVYFPYILSRKEVRRLIRRASQHQGRNIWSGMLRILLLILYCTGLRFGEAVRLNLSDVDLKRSLLVIRESKGRTRIVPFGADLAQEIAIYLRKRAKIAQNCDATDALFLRLNGRPLTLFAASDAVRRLLRREGLKSSCGRVGPRPYDRGMPSRSIG